MKTALRKTGDVVELEGVKGWSPAERPSSIHAAQAAVMQAVGADVSYDMLVGVSGLAFRTQVSKPGLCPSSPHSFCGYRCVERSVRALPWEVRVYEINESDKAAAEGAWQAIVESIDRGVPVQYGSEEDGIIVGYLAHGRKRICLHPMHENGTSTFIETSWPWGVAVFTGPRADVDSHAALAVGAFQQAVDMADATEADDYFVGTRAWQSYINKLQTLDSADTGTRNGAMLGNAWIYECLVHYRGVAARYLRDTAKAFDSDVSAHLLRAADAYEDVSTRILADASTAAGAIAPYEWTLPDGRSWDGEMRGEQVRRLREAEARERNAIAEIKHALSRISPPGD